MAAQPYVIRALPGVPELEGGGILVASPRGRLLDAMTAAIAEHGYAATSVAEVINRARASRRTFYERFTDKENCYLEAFKVASDYLAAQIATATADTTTITDRIERFLDCYLGELVRYPLAARAFVVEIRAAGAPSQQHRRTIQDQFAALLRMPEGDDNPLMRTAFVAAADELIARQITDNGAEQLTQLAPGLLELAQRILDRPPPKSAARPRPQRRTRAQA